MRRGRSWYHLKDLFTLVNLAAGVLAVRYVLDDQPRRAGYAVIVGFLLGDLLDGQVARMTGTANRVGAELDTLVDHFVHVVVPSLILLEIYSDGGHGWLGLVALGALVGAATVRHARLASLPFDFPQGWFGLPRTISGFAAMGLVLSRTFQTGSTADYWVAFIVVIVLSAMNVAPIPYLHHRGKRGLTLWMKVLVGLFVVTPVIAFAFQRAATFDVLTFWVVGYALTGWLPVSAPDRRAFYVEYRRWRKAIALT